MTFDTHNDTVSDILIALVREFDARGESITRFAQFNGLTFHQAWTFIQMGRELIRHRSE